MKRLVLLAPVLALVAACSQGPDTIQPGQWEMAVQMTEFDAPGAPPEVANQMRAMMATGQSQTQARCITPEEAANPTRGMMNPSGQAEGCTYTEQTFAGGRIQIAGSCPVPGNRGTVKTTMTGSYTATTMETRLNSEIDAGANAPPGAPRIVRMGGTMTGRRTGDCPAG
ncbi:DUF3617 domain-containing protein [Sphingosinicella sp. LHD-64]|uniref:DUF3617 domain-containing protein n=1 Tax=Sphingosinicella sp. LHD-64 TaxID=3072139 RepID=UPI0028103A51|nr:DUF3617 domain-containing protein [Sphingosinicella sp. LHD-64]MDQ8758060.1 DUF3617 domain-containing protein [Sphingosinicella sp. LHD-64]